MLTGDVASESGQEDFRCGMAVEGVSSFRKAVANGCLWALEGVSDLMNGPLKFPMCKKLGGF